MFWFFFKVIAKKKFSSVLYYIPKYALRFPFHILFVKVFYDHPRSCFDYDIV